MKKLLSFITILFFLAGSLSVAQTREISVDGFLQTLPNRVYYVQDELILNQRYKYYRYDLTFYESYQPAVQPIRILDTDSFGLMKKLNGYFYWVPDLTTNADPLKFELPDGRRLEFSHNRKPPAKSDYEYKRLNTRLDMFSKDFFTYKRTLREIERYDHSDQMLSLLTSATLGGIGVWAFASERRLFNEVGNHTVGAISAAISVTGIIGYIRYRKRINRLTKQKEELVNKYN